MSSEKITPLVRPAHVRTPGTRQRLSVEKRFAIIALLERGVPRREVMREYNLKHSSNVTTILKRKESIVRAMAKDTTARAKAIRSSKFPMIDKQLRDFVTHHNGQGTRVSYPTLTQFALRLAREYGVLSRFSASRAYMDKFLSNQILAAVAGQGTAPSQHVPNAVTKTSTVKPGYEYSSEGPEKVLMDEIPAAAAPKVAQVTSYLKSRFILKLQDFIRQHLEKVGNQVNNVMKQTAFMSDEEVAEMVHFKDGLRENLHEFSGSAITTLSELQELDVNRFIDLAENLMYRLITLSESLLIRLTRLSRDLQLRGADSIENGHQIELQQSSPSSDEASSPPPPLRGEQHSPVIVDVESE